MKTISLVNLSQITGGAMPSLRTVGEYAAPLLGLSQITAPLAGMLANKGAARQALGAGAVGAAAGAAGGPAGALIGGAGAAAGTYYGALLGRDFPAE